MVGLEHTVQEYDVGSQVVPYSIPLEDFQATPPSNPKHYNISERVTRETFLSWYVGSFSKSRGSPDAQYTFMNWFEANYGFDYRTTFNNFWNAGHWSCLSEQEQKMFISAFRKVSDHKGGTDDRIIDGFKRYVLTFSNPEAKEHELVDLSDEDEEFGNELLKGMSLHGLTDLIDWRM